MPKPKNTLSMTSIGLLCAAAIVGTSTVAHAEALPSDESIEAIAAVAPDVLDAAADASTSPTKAATYATDDVRVSVPVDASDGASLRTNDQELTVSLPFADQATEATVTESGVATFDNNNASTTTPVVRDDGTLQILTVIDDATAPARYDYELSVPAGGTMAIREDGVVILTDSDDGFAGTVAPAWAKDAAGAPVATHYEINGNTLTQVVEHGAGTQYPVVADPWLGITLFQSFRRDSYQGDYRYSAWVTGPGAIVLSGGGGVGGYLAGQAVFRGAGWAEWKAKWPAITNKATLQQQYNCHVAASSYGLPFTQDYNLERFRANRSDWAAGVVSHRCNW